MLILTIIVVIIGVSWYLNGVFISYKKKIKNLEQKLNEANKIILSTQNQKELAEKEFHKKIQLLENERRHFSERNAGLNSNILDLERKIDELQSSKNLTESNLNKIIEENKKAFDSHALKLNEQIDWLTIRRKDLEASLKLKDELYESLKAKDNESVSKITSLYSDFLLVQYDISSKHLLNKVRPAQVEAKRIEALKNETKDYIEQFRKMTYKYEALLQLFPELTNYVEDFETINELSEIKDLNALQDDYDRVQFYISKEEYTKLDIDERNQLALNRYISGQKSKWQIGRDYELFCGQEYEKNGWDVEYIGMEKKFEDMGRDLIARKNNEVHIIQCKYWSQEKLIHEKHITQLFGTALEYSLSKGNENVLPVLITNISLSDTARRFASTLLVTVKEYTHLQDYPRIKCNVNRDQEGNKTLIYHLPFDQQYDRTKISSNDECYAFNVKEAVRKGFRRAKRYYGQ